MTIANIINAGSGSAATSYNTASVAPVSNRLYMFSVINIRGGGSPAIPTVTGAGLTWTQVDTVTSGNYRLTQFKALSSTPGSGVLTIDFGGSTQSSIAWVLDEIMPTETAPDAANAIGIFGHNSSTGSQTGILVSISPFASPKNATYSSVLSGPTTPAAGSGFTRYGLASDGIINIVIGTEFQDANDGSVDWTWGATNSTFLVIGMEIKADSSAGLLNSDI